jgi:hypothetical protein
MGSDSSYGNRGAEAAAADDVDEVFDNESEDDGDDEDEDGEADGNVSDEAECCVDFSGRVNRLVEGADVGAVAEEREGEEIDIVLESTSIGEDGRSGGDGSAASSAKLASHADRVFVTKSQVNNSD